MLRGRLALSIAVLAAGINAEEDYRRMREVMDKWEYTWDPVKVTTEDGFILTTFHVTGNSSGKFTPTKPPVLIQHGDYGDGAGWLRYYPVGKPMHLQLADDGYDVWIGNNRGTNYSQERTDDLKPTDEAYWNWSWAAMGIYDDVANIKAIKQQSGAEKVFYLGYSQGTVQMFYALAHLEDSFFVDNLYKFLAFAPCTISPKDGPESYWLDNLYDFQSIGVYGLYGDSARWDEDKAKICSQLSEEACSMV